jgi:cysteine desulfurase
MIYLDHAATTPLHPVVREKIISVLDEFGNPSSLHHYGRRSKDIIDEARSIIAVEMQALFSEIVFTGSGSESNHLAIIGAALANQNQSRNQIILNAGEHHCVLYTRPILEKLGYEVVVLPIDEEAFLDPELVEATMNNRTLLLSVMHANNETGTIQWANTFSSMCDKYGVIFHCDMIQTFCKGVGYVPGAHLVSVAAHKINGPKGVGALFIRGGTLIKPLIRGGSQERDLRAGTENVMGISGFGEAVKQRVQNPIEVGEMRDSFEKELISFGAVALVTTKERLDSHCHLRFEGVDAETLLIRLDREGIAASSGAACSSGSVEPSHVVLAMGLSEKYAKEAIRFSFGLNNTVGETLSAAKIIIKCVDEIRCVKSNGAS